MNAAADPKHRQLPLKYEVLHCLLAPSDVGGSLLHREQRGLNPADNRREFVSILNRIVSINFQDFLDESFSGSSGRAHAPHTTYFFLSEHLSRPLQFQHHSFRRVPFPRFLGTRTRRERGVLDA